MLSFKQYLKARSSPCATKNPKDVLATLQTKKQAKNMMLVLVETDKEDG